MADDASITTRCPNCARLERRIADQEQRVAPLEQLLEKATRAQKRQAAPFAKGTPKADPKTPGRKAGDAYGPKAHRPLPEQEPDEIIDVPLPHECPDCGGLTEEDHIEQQFQVEIPRRPLVRRFDTHVGRCRRCGRRLRPRHPLQTSQATGAAASQLGSDLQALIALMKDKYGLSYGDIRGLLERATRGALRFPRKVQDFLREALALRDRRDDGTIGAHGLAVVRGRLEKRLDRLLDGRLSHPGNRTFQKHLVGHREEILTFLYEPDIEATNWPAEQAVRPLGVNRKVFGGNRTAAGGHAQEVLGSVFATLAQRALDTLSLVSRIICLLADQRPPFIQRFLPIPPN
jgi:transposase